LSHNHGELSVPNTLLPLGSSLLSLVFAAMVFDQWRQTRRSFQLVWAVGLLCYAIGAGTEFAGSAFGWNEPLYRAWYLFGAVLVAAYLGMGTIYLLARTSFGYFAAVTIFLGGVLSWVFSVLPDPKTGQLLYPGAVTVGAAAFVLASVGAVAIGLATALRREWAAHFALAVLVAASLAAAYLVLAAPLPAPGFVLAADTHVPVGAAFPGYVRVLTGPFNIFGALCLVFGAAFSAYVYMPKRKLLAAQAVRIPVLAQLWYFVAVVVNLVASLPGAARALLAGNLNSRVPATLLIAAGGLVPSITSGLNRFGITWAFLLGEFVGVLLIFAGFLVSEDVFRNLRVIAAGTVWQRREKAEASG
jgi:hypothetical protein